MHTVQHARWTKDPLSRLVEAAAKGEPFIIAGPHSRWSASPWTRRASRPPGSTFLKREIEVPEDFDPHLGEGLADLFEDRE